MKKQLAKIVDSYLKYATGLLLLVIPLYPKFPFIAVPGTYVAIRLEDFLIAALLSGWFLILLWRRTNIFKDPLVVAVTWFFIAVFLSAINAVLVTKTVVPYIAILHALRRVEYIAVMFLAASAVATREHLKFYVKLIILAAFIATIYGAGQKFFALPVISTMNKEFAQGLALSLGPEARVSSTFAGHYDLAAYLVPVLLLTLTVIFIPRRFLARLGIFVLFTLFIWLMVASASRVSIVAYLVPAVLLLLIIRRWRWIIPVLAVTLTLAAFSQSLTSRYAKLTSVVVSSAYTRYLAFISTFNPEIVSQPGIIPFSTEFPSMATPGAGLKGKIAKASPKPRRLRPSPTPYVAPVIEDRSSAIRFNVEWPRAVRAFEKNPLLGTGPSSITLATDNDYLRALGETGLLGFLAFANIFLQIALIVKKLLKKSISTIEGALGWGMLFGTMGLLINAVFIDVFEASKVAITYWLLVGIWVGTARLLTRYEAL